MLEDTEEAEKERKPKREKNLHTEDTEMNFIKVLNIWNTVITLTDKEFSEITNQFM